MFDALKIQRWFQDVKLWYHTGAEAGNDARWQ